MKLLRHTWHLGLWCTRKGCLLALWSLWLLLLAAACIQFYVIRTHELTLPAPLRSLIEHRLADRGFVCTFSRGTLDFSGRILLENVALGPVSTPSPLLTARSVYLRLDPWDLALRRLNLLTLSASGAALHLPALVSPSGQDETLANDIDFTLTPQGSLLRLDHLTARIGNLSLHASGALRLPASADPSATSASLDKLIAAYLRSGRELPPLIARLDALDSPSLGLVLIPSEHRLVTLRAALRADRLDLSSIPEARGAITGPLTLRADVPLGADTPALLRAEGSLATLSAPGLGSVQDLRFSLRGLLPRHQTAFSPLSLDLQYSSLRLPLFTTGPARLTLLPRPGGWFAADLLTDLADSPWQLHALLDPAQKQARLSLDGRIDTSLLRFLGPLVHHDLAGLLDPAVPATLHADATLLPGWKLDQATGRIHTGPVNVARVPLDETGTEFTYRDGRVLCDHLVLRQGSSVAHGLYEMDAATQDFRFLLIGGLRPDGISPWFHDWWTRFWDDFDFTRSVPQADVDVTGRWGDLTATRVFVTAENGLTRLRGVPFDHVRTRLFVRPQWDDILWLDLAQDGRSAAGTFDRLTDLDKDTWSRMTFAITSGLPLGTMQQLFGPDAAELLAPYHFDLPPELVLSGHVESPAFPGGARQHIDIGLRSSGPASFHDFAVSDLVFTAQLRDDALALTDLSLTLAGGRARGAAKIWGAPPDRRISLDATLSRASLGAAIHAVNLAPAAPPKPGEKTLEQRLASGLLDLSLTAEGRYNDFNSFTGTGTAAITGADLGEINLFGLLSELLKKTVILNFTSFSLDRLGARFAIDGPRLHFNELKIAGPSASIDAKGTYGLQDHALDFKAKIFPFDESKSLVGSTVGFVLSPFSSALEVKLDGTLATPHWVFVYGPVNLLRSLIGGPSAPPPAPAAK